MVNWFRAFHIRGTYLIILSIILVFHLQLLVDGVLMNLGECVCTWCSRSSCGRNCVVLNESILPIQHQKSTSFAPIDREYTKRNTWSRDSMRHHRCLALPCHASNFIIARSRSLASKKKTQHQPHTNNLDNTTSTTTTLAANHANILHIARTEAFNASQKEHGRLQRRLTYPSQCPPPTPYTPPLRASSPKTPISTLSSLCHPPLPPSPQPTLSVYSIPQPSNPFQMACWTWIKRSLLWANMTKRVIS